MTPVTRAIDLARIDTRNRLRPINPNVVSALAEEFSNGNRWPAIRVVERGEGFRLISGGHRFATATKLGWAEIEAEVYPAEAYADEASIRLDEVRENLLRYELTALDRAVHLSTWKEIYEAEKKVRGRGRPNISQNSATFQERFSTAAATALGISERTIQQAVAIAAGLAQPIRERIAFAGIADNASELQQLAKQHPDRQGRIVNLLLSNPPAATTVAEAVAVLDRTPAPERLQGWRKVSDTFARLKAVDQEAFFDAHAEAIEQWLEHRRAQTAKAA